MKTMTYNELTDYANNPKLKEDKLKWEGWLERNTYKLGGKTLAFQPEEIRIIEWIRTFPVSLRMDIFHISHDEVKALAEHNLDRRTKEIIQLLKGRFNWIETGERFNKSEDFIWQEKIGMTYKTMVTKLDNKLLSDAHVDIVYGFLTDLREIVPVETSK